MQSMSVLALGAHAPPRPGTCRVLRRRRPLERTDRKGLESAARGALGEVNARAAARPPPDGRNKNKSAAAAPACSRIKAAGGGRARRGAGAGALPAGARGQSHPAGRAHRSCVRAASCRVPLFGPRIVARPTLCACVCVIVRSGRGGHGACRGAQGAARALAACARAPGGAARPATPPQPGAGGRPARRRCDRQGRR
ncbi:hypothetical protein EVAR_50432_1 [Eumeta japonica]|uniref:Uncharacterized protein n=1 Tax=Eumeta variegata TaxID=151549 RepID=A0A4C1XWK3_EUMVA|nr:hypothetical protein EVAR_50432_1 [Eumeta japonica]